MTLAPIDEAHALQIQAGVIGRKTGHFFEAEIASQIDRLNYPLNIPLKVQSGNLFTGNPAFLLICYICNRLSITRLHSAKAVSTGALATSEGGKQCLLLNGVSISSCKSDLLVTVTPEYGPPVTVGVSTKQCNNKTPTNAQLFFTTAQRFSDLLIQNEIQVSNAAISALKHFCGDSGYRPMDQLSGIGDRTIDHRRFFWEELDPIGRKEWEDIFNAYQDRITKMLFQKAYLNDPFIPDFLLHKTKAALCWNETEVAIYTIDEIVNLSRSYGGFSTKEYSVNKGSYRDPVGARKHEAPRLGIIQMQRSGQAQHPTQLQFNLEAGYFYKFESSSHSNL